MLHLPPTPKFFDLDNPNQEALSALHAVLVAGLPVEETLANLYQVKMLFRITQGYLSSIL